MVVSWMKTHWFVITGFSGVFFFGSIATIPWLIVRVPTDYFKLKKSVKQSSRNPILRLLFHLFKNLFGVVFLLMGFIMLFTPGQGFLTVMIGVVLIDFPGKRWLERYLISRPRVFYAVNAIRKKYGNMPFEL